MKKNLSIINEIKKSISSPVKILEIALKDFLFYIIITIIFLVYTLIVYNSLPLKPSFTPETILEASAFEISQSAQQLTSFLAVYALSTILFIICLILLITVFKEWIWGKSILKKKFQIKNLPKFLWVILSITAIITLIFLIIIGISGALLQFLYYKNFPPVFLQILAFIIFFIMLPFIMHINNFSSYYFVNERKYLHSLKQTLYSFKEIKALSIHYLIILIVFFIIGYFSNLLLYISESLIMSIISLFILLLFLAWQRIYAVIIYKRLF